MPKILRLQTFGGIVNVQFNDEETGVILKRAYSRNPGTLNISYTVDEANASFFLGLQIEQDAYTVQFSFFEIDGVSFAGASIDTVAAALGVVFNDAGGSGVTILSTATLNPTAINVTAPQNIDVFYILNPNSPINNEIQVEVDQAMVSKETFIVADMRRPGFDPSEIVTITSDNGYPFIVMQPGTGVSFVGRVEITTRAVRVTKVEQYDDSYPNNCYLVYFMGN